MVTIDR